MIEVGTDVVEVVFPPVVVVLSKDTTCPLGVVPVDLETVDVFPPGVCVTSTVTVFPLTILVD